MTEPSAPVRRKQLKPFGADRAHELMLKQEALAKMTRQQAFEKGYIGVKDLDDEELRYGRCRDDAGYIPKNGMKTELIPKDKYDEMIAEHELRFKQKLRQNLDDMLDGMVEIAKDETVEPRDRLEAMKYLIDRTVGKAVDKVDVTVKTAPWEDMLGQVVGIAPMSRAEHRAIQGAGIVDAEVIEDEETTVQPSHVPEAGKDTAEQAVVQVHKPRPQEQPPKQPQGQFDGDAPEPGEPYDEYVDLPVGPDHTVKVDNDRPAATNPAVDSPNNTDLHYGRRADQKRTYVDQARAADDLAKRRKEARDKIKNAKKERAIARATGADAIKDEITGATLGADGKLTFDIE